MSVSCKASVCLQCLLMSILLATMHKPIIISLSKNAGINAITDR